MLWSESGPPPDTAGRPRAKPRKRTRLLTVLRVVPATAVAANVLDLFPDVTVDRKGHVVVVVVVVAVWMLAVPLLVVVERHYFDQAERLLLGLLHRHGHVFSEARGEPSAVHDGGRWVHRRVVARPEHGVKTERFSGARCYDGRCSHIKEPAIRSYLPLQPRRLSAVIPTP